MSGLLKFSLRAAVSSQTLRTSARSWCAGNNSVLRQTVPKTVPVQWRRYSSNQNDTDDGPPKSSSFGKWILLALTVMGAGSAGIAYQYGLFEKTESSSSSSSAKEVEKKKNKVPLEAKDIPKEVQYLLVGGGTASFAAFRAIKSHEPKAKVMVITDEYEMPYMRPPLSKEIWSEVERKAGSGKRLTFRQWNGVERSIFYEPDDFYVDPTLLNESPNGGVAVVRGYTVARLDVNGKKAILSDGTEIAYDKCLLATGSSPKTLAVFDKASADVQSRVSVFRSVDHFEKLMKTTGGLKSIAIVGGGFLGSEMACALAKYGGGAGGKGLKVHQIFHEKGNMAKVLPEYLSGWTMDRVKEEGVTVHSELEVVSVEGQKKQVKLGLSNGESLTVDHVIVAVGSEPNTRLAEVSKLETDAKIGGFIVNAELLARNSVYAAGDASNFYDPHLGRRRVEHHDHAVVSGRLAGENMVGLNKPYTHQSMFWSDLGPRVGYEAIGIVDASLKTVAIFAKSAPEAVAASTEQDDAASPNDSSAAAKPSDVVIKSQAAAMDGGVEPLRIDNDEYDKGVILYLRDDRIVGILLWNVFNRINIARKIISQDVRTKDFQEVAKLFNIHDSPQDNNKHSD